MKEVSNTWKFIDVQRLDREIVARGVKDRQRLQG